MSELDATERAVLELIVQTKRGFAGHETYTATTADIAVARVVTDYFCDDGDMDLPPAPLTGIDRTAPKWWRGSAG